MLNPDLFAAFLLITVVLLLTPGPIVTLVIATGVTQGLKAALHPGLAQRRREAPAPIAQVQVRRGFLVALSNPKTLAFFTALRPQFVDPTLPPRFQLAAMCAVSVFLAAVTDSVWAIAAGLGRTWFMEPARAKSSAGRPGRCWSGRGVAVADAPAGVAPQRAPARSRIATTAA